MEMTYEAQRYFPPKCVDCPFLVGLIEDDYISSSDEVSKAEVLEGLRVHVDEVNFEACPGPITWENSNGVNTSCTQLDDEIGIK